LINELNGIVEVEDDTDINYHVSFNYELRSGSRHWYLSLSMIDKYALFYRINEMRQFHLLNDKEGTPIENNIIRIIESHQFIFLSSEILKNRIPFQIRKEQSENPTLYQCLFSLEGDPAD
jgi:hypothetical protein